MVQMKNILVAGATSLIAQETIRFFAAKERASFLLVGRNPEKLRLLADDLRTRGATRVECLTGDLCDEAFHKTMVDTATATLGRLDLAYIAWGDLPKEEVAQSDYEATKAIFHTNFLSIVSLLIRLAKVFEQQKQGTIAVISSVAGDRGRQSNFVYGSTKAALSAYLQGFRNRLYRFGVTVITIKPGVIRTPMTAHIKHGPLSGDPKHTGESIYHGILKGRDVIYVPWYWRIIMSIVCAIPETIFKRLKM